MPFCFLFFVFGKRKIRIPGKASGEPLVFAGLTLSLMVFQRMSGVFGEKNARPPGMTALSLRPSDNEKNGSPIFFALGKRKIRIPGKNCFKNLRMRSFSLPKMSFYGPVIGIFPLLCRAKRRKALCVKAFKRRGSIFRFKRLFLKSRCFIP